MSHKKMVEATLAALATLVAAEQAVAAEMDMATMQKPGFERCYGIAKKGHNDCAAHQHQCGGFAKVDSDPKEWIFVPTGTCHKIVGGHLTPVSLPNQSNDKAK